MKLHEVCRAHVFCVFFFFGGREVVLNCALGLRGSHLQRALQAMTAFTRPRIGCVTRPLVPWQPGGCESEPVCGNANV